MSFLINNLLMRNDDERNLVASYLDTLTLNTFVATCLAHELRESGEIEVEDIADNLTFISALARYRTDKEMREPALPFAQVVKEREEFFERKLKAKFPPVRTFKFRLTASGTVLVSAHNAGEAAYEINRIKSNMASLMLGAEFAEDNEINVEEVIGE